MSDLKKAAAPFAAEEAKRLCVLANRILANENVVDAFGHVSIRNPENPGTFFIARSVSPEFVVPGDILECDLECAVLTETPHRPYIERAIHARIYRARPEVTAVCHAHPLEVMPFTCTGRPFVIVSNSYSEFYEGIPVSDDRDEETLLVGTSDSGDRLARALGDKRAVFMKNHGVTVVGESIKQLVSSTIALKNGAEILWRTLLLDPNPQCLTYEAMIKGNTPRNPAGTDRAWEYWTKRALRAYPDLADTLL